MRPRDVGGVCRNAGGAAMRAQPLGVSVEPPYGDTVHVRGVPRCGGTAMRALPLEPSVGLPLGRGAREGCAKMGAAPPCERGQ